MQFHVDARICACAVTQVGLTLCCSCWFDSEVKRAVDEIAKKHKLVRAPDDLTRASHHSSCAPLFDVFGRWVSAPDAVCC